VTGQQGASAAEPGTSATSGPSSPLRRGRAERIFRRVAVLLAAALVLLAAPGWFFVRGYRRASWADRHGIELSVRAGFGTPGFIVGPSDAAQAGLVRVDEAAFRELARPGFVEGEAGGRFWGAFYGLGNRLYHRNAGSRIPEVPAPEELRARQERVRELRVRQQHERAALAERAQALTEQLGELDFARREAASAELRRIGPPALPALRRAARSPDPEVASRAEALIGQIADDAQVPAPDAGAGKP
jgi:hypothetical protein